MNNETKQRKQIIDLVQKLHRHAESAEKIGSIHEANVFASKVQKLLMEYELSMEDVIGKKEEKILQHLVDWKKWGFKQKNARCAWIESLAWVITKAYSCKFLVCPGSNRIYLVGHESSIETAEYALVTLVKTIDALSVKTYMHKAYETGKKGEKMLPGYRTSWIQGFITAIHEHFTEERKRQQTVPGSDDCRALIILDNKLTLVEEYLKTKHTKKIAPLTVNRIHNYAGFEHGLEEGTKAMNRNGIEHCPSQQIGFNQ